MCPQTPIVPEFARTHQYVCPKSDVKANKKDFRRTLIKCIIGIIDDIFLVVKTVGYDFL